MNYNKKNYQWSESENFSRFNIHLNQIISHIDNELVIVTDADETLSKNDSSRIFWELNFGKNSWLDFRGWFEKNGRNYNSFMDAAIIYSKIDIKEYAEFCEKAASLIELRGGWNEFKKIAPTIIIVTSGIKLLWEKVIEINGWDNTYIIGGNHFLLDNYIVDQNIKSELVMKLKKINKKVIAFGDSRLDAQMLKNSDLGCVIVNERRSPGLAECVMGLKHVYQIRTDQEPIDDLPICAFEDVLKKFYLLDN